MHGAEAERAVEEALNVGYRLIDTAAIYENEKDVGAALRASGVPRHDVFVTTKLWNEDHGDPEAALAASLRRLGLAYVDLYLMHWPVPQRNATWKILEDLCEAGLCRSIGVSNFTSRHLRELFAVATKKPAVNQVEFTPFLYQRDLLGFCEERGIDLEEESPLTHGERLGDKSLHGVAKNYGKSPAQMLLRWALQHNVLVIPKAAKPEHVRENAQIFDFSLQKEDMQSLDRLDRGFRICWDPTTMP